MEHARACAHKLEETWDTLELGIEERQTELRKTMEAASSSWDAAVARAEQRRLLVLSQIESMQREAAKIAEQLGAQHDQVNGRCCSNQPCSRLLLHHIAGLAALCTANVLALSG